MPALLFSNFQDYRFKISSYANREPGAAKVARRVREGLSGAKSWCV